MIVCLLSVVVLASVGLGWVLRGLGRSHDLEVLIPGVSYVVAPGKLAKVVSFGPYWVSFDVDGEGYSLRREDALRAVNQLRRERAS